MQKATIWWMPLVSAFALGLSLRPDVGAGFDKRPTPVAGVVPPPLPAEPAPIVSGTDGRPGNGAPSRLPDLRPDPATRWPTFLPDPPAGPDRYRLTSKMQAGLRLLGEGWTAELFDLQGDAGQITRFRLDGRVDAEDLVGGVPHLSFPFALRVEWSGGGEVGPLRQLLGNPRLRALTLRDCSLHAPGVAGLFGGVPDLEHLDIAGCRLDGGALAAIAARLPELRTLRMDGMPWMIDRMPAEMPSLRFLDVRNTRLGPEAWKAVARYPRLEVLLAGRKRPSLYRGDMTVDIGAIVTCRTLRELDLSGCALGIHFGTIVTTLPRLERLRIADCDMAFPALPDPSRLVPLVELDVRGTALWNDAVAAVSRLPGLRVLKPGRNWSAFLDAGLISAESDLREIDLTGSWAEPHHIVALARLPMLSRLKLNGAVLSYAEIVAGLAGLEHLDLSDSGDLSSGQLGHLARLTKLKSLTLTNCKLSVDATAEFHRFGALELLHLSGCRLVDADLRPLIKSERLADLDISANPGITDAGLRHVAEIASLRRLRLCNKWGLGPRITVDGLQAFLRDRPEVMVDCRPEGPDLQRIVPSLDP